MLNAHTDYVLLTNPPQKIKNKKQKKQPPKKTNKQKATTQTKQLSCSGASLPPSFKFMDLALVCNVTYI